MAYVRRESVACPPRVTPPPVGRGQDERYATGCVCSPRSDIRPLLGSVLVKPHCHFALRAVAPHTKSSRLRIFPPPRDHTLSLGEDVVRLAAT